jgi:uncharacterized protein
MRLDPLIDRAEYNTALHLEELMSSRPLAQLLPTLRESNDPAANALALRIENLGLLSCEIWALGQQAATDIIDSRPSATVLDLGGFAITRSRLWSHCQCSMSFGLDATNGGQFSRDRRSP